MTRDKWRDILEIIGIVSIVASLVFVGLQISQEQTMNRYQADADFDDTMFEYARIIGESPEIWRKGLNGGELTASEEIQFQALAYIVEQKFTGIYSRASLVKGGRNLDGIARQFASNLYAFPGLRREFLSRCHRINSMGLEPPFCAHVERTLGLLDSGELPAAEGVHFIL
jgi:hypothetical protein